MGLQRRLELGGLFAYGTEGTLYWTLVYALSLPAVPVILWRSRTAPLSERRRVSIFASALALGAGPLLLWPFLLYTIPGLTEFIADPSRQLWQFVISYPLLALTPLASTYAVLVYRVLEVRLIIRAAIQYALARYTVLAATGLPIVVLFAFLYQNREQTLVSLLTGTRPAMLLGGTGLGILTYQVRGRVITTIDRRFFREQYDTNQILARLVEQIRTTSASYELTSILGDELDRALHLQTLGTFVLDLERAVLRSADGRSRPLGLTSDLAGILEAETESLDVDPGDPRAAFREMGTEDQEWIVDHSFVLLVPLIGSTGRLVGLMALGEKRASCLFLQRIDSCDPQSPVLRH